jgi:hypothetical protein
MRFPIPFQLALLVLIPLGLLLWIGNARIGDLRSEAEVADGQARRSGLMIATTRLIDALQRERGLSVVAASGGSAGDLGTVRATTEEHLAAWRGPAEQARFASAPRPEELGKRVAAARSGGGDAIAIRTRYSEVIGSLIAVQSAIPNAPTNRGLGKLRPPDLQDLAARPIGSAGRGWYPGTWSRSG